MFCVGLRKWRRRWRKRGRLGFTSQMGRPATGPMSTFTLLIPLPFASFPSSLRTFSLLILFPLASFLLSWCLLLPVYVRLALSPFHMRLFSLSEIGFPLICETFLDVLTLRAVFL